MLLCRICIPTNTREVITPAAATLWRIVLLDMENRDRGDFIRITENQMTFCRLFLPPPKSARIYRMPNKIAMVGNRLRSPYAIGGSGWSWVSVLSNASKSIKFIIFVLRSGEQRCKIPQSRFVPHEHDPLGQHVVARPYLPVRCSVALGQSDRRTKRPFMESA